MPQYEFSDNKDSTYIFFCLAYAEAILVIPDDDAADDHYYHDVYIYIYYIYI